MSLDKTKDLEPSSEGKGSIYVVDDEPMLLELASYILEPLGYRIEIFRDPKAALRSYSSGNPLPRLVITDYAMHSMNGMDLIAECRRISPDQKILLLSGTVDEHVYRNAPSKPDRFLAKPYQAKQLVDIVSDVLHG
jgi:CheY-like chemotaxis protein